MWSVLGRPKHWYEVKYSGKFSLRRQEEETPGRASLTFIGKSKEHKSPKWCQWQGCPEIIVVACYVGVWGNTVGE